MVDGFVKNKKLNRTNQCTVYWCRYVRPKNKTNHVFDKTEQLFVVEATLIARPGDYRKYPFQL